MAFRDRSENADVATELSLQPWRAFQPDGVIMFSDILTPLPSLGIEWDIKKGFGPVISTPIRRCTIPLLHPCACTHAATELDSGQPSTPSSS